MQESSRECGLGGLARLPDELVCGILERLDVRTITVLSCVSKLLRIFCAEEPLWQSMALTLCGEKLDWKGSWRSTALSTAPKDNHLIPEIAFKSNFGRVFPVPGFSSDYLYKRWYRAHMDLSSFLPASESIPRISARNLTAQDFAVHFDVTGQPVIINSLQDSWEAMNWNIESLCEKFGSEAFIVNCPGKMSVKMALRNFHQYMQDQQDEDAIYLFDGEFGENVPELLNDYEIPHIFPEDFYSALGSERPPYRWVLIGPAGSGSIWHVDPTATSAWNSLISGRKRWALYPPGVIPPDVTFTSFPHPSSQDLDFQSPPALIWLLETLPQLTQDQLPIEFIQNPGETVFIPAGWWHCVINLEPSVAVTQNFVSKANLKSVVKCLAIGAYGYYSEVYDGESWGGQAGWLPVIGCRWLGRWMHMLWDNEPAMEELLWDCACESMHGEFWFEALKFICGEVGLNPPTKCEAIPLSATSNWVFKTGDYVIKVYMDKVSIRSVIRCIVEQDMHEMLGNCDKSLANFVPCTKGFGHLNLPSPNDSTKNVVGKLLNNAPFLVTSHCYGVSLAQCFSSLSEANRIEVSKVISSVLGRVHNVVDVCSTSIDSKDTMLTNECDGKSMLEFTELSDISMWCCRLMNNGTVWQAQDCNRAWSSCIGYIENINVDMEEGDSKEINLHESCCSRLAICVDPDERSRLGNWYPFVSFLRWRRNVACKHHRKLGTLPKHLVDELDSYLPEDPVSLVLGGNSVGEWKPHWLHGDLTHDNVIVDSNNPMLSKDNDNGEGDASSNHVSTFVIDFGDAGHGDPLYDFVAVYISTLKCKEGLMNGFLEAYVSACSDLVDGKWWLGRRDMLQYVVTCYMLLHEDDPIRRVFELRCELKGVASLKELEAKFWGVLNPWMK